MGTNLTALLLERCAKTIEEVIVPKVSGNFEVQQAMATAQVLRILAPNVDEKPEYAIKENRKIQEVLNNVLIGLRKEADASSSQNKVMDGLSATIADGLNKSDQGLTSAGEKNVLLKGLLIDTIKGIDSLAADLPQDLINVLKQEIRTAIRQQLDNETARLGSRSFSSEFLSEEAS
ncbi:MAG: hypothetical protein HKP58_05905 [Desulfatitalea sp.]|nr:hypothetical protein [Desulfatitalea sp.]NNJ99929.1 hypothetical protein [Desulfatitalea sp.]